LKIGGHNKLNNNQKRNQYKIKLFNFHEITDAFGHLTAPENIDRTITVSDSIYLDQLQQVVAAHNPLADFNDAVFMLKANNIDEDDPAQLALFERILRDGIYYKNEKYIRSIKSPAMGRTQRTEFIKEKYYEALFNRISLGCSPALTNINKWESALGISRSTAMPIPYIPRVVVIPDYEKDEIIEDVWKIEKCDEDSEQPKLVFTEKERQREYFKAKKELKPEQEQLLALEPIPNKRIDISYDECKMVPDQSEFKTFSGWDKEHRRVKIEEISKPMRSAAYNGKLSPCYSLEQTEEVPIIEISETSIGLKRVEYLPYPNKNVQFFDGQGLMSFQFAERIQGHLGLNYAPNAVQGRMPFIKGNFIRFDILNWLEEKEVSEIVDVFNVPQPIIDQEGRAIDLILTKSCFKAWHKYMEGKDKPECIFKNIAEYVQLLAEYQHNSFWVANYAKPSYQLKPYTPLTYQYIHALDLSYDDLRLLSKPLMDVIKRVLYGKKDDQEGHWIRDIAFTKAFLNMIALHDEPKDVEDDDNEPTDEEEQQDKEKFTDEILQAIDINPLMLHDGNVRNFIVKQAMQKVKDLMRGRIPVRGSYYYLTNDPIAFMEHAANKPVVGVLKKNQAFMNRKLGTHALFRSPLTIYNEVGKLEFVKVHNPYIRHLDNVIVLNCKDLTLARLGLGDVDGDTALCTDDPTILAAVIDSPTIINEDDKKTAKPVANHIESIVQLELKSLHNLTGRCTNVNTFFQNLALEEGDLKSRVLENSCLKFLQGSIIDATKNGMDVEIPYVLDRFAIKMPYFFRFINGGTEDEYQFSTKTPFNQFCCKVESYIKDKFQEKDGKLDRQLLGIESTKQLLQDLGKVNHSRFLKGIAYFEPVYKEYNQEKQRINRLQKEFNQLKKWERDEDSRKAISAEYKALKDKYKAKCEALCPYPSILASIAVEIAYVNYGTHSFPWLFTEGLMENLKRNENLLKQEVMKVNRLSNCGINEGKLVVQDGMAAIADLKFKLGVPDGSYELMEIMGQYFITYDAVRETEVQTSQTPSLLEGKSTRREIKGYTMGFSSLKQTLEETKLVVNEVMGKKFILKNVENRYVNVVNDLDETIFYISRDYVINQAEQYSLFDFDGAMVEFVKLDEVFKKSFKAIVNIE
jgi:hypothetical protein